MRHKKNKVRIKWGRFLLSVFVVAAVVFAGVKIFSGVAGGYRPGPSSANSDEDSLQEVRTKFQLTIRCAGDIMAHMPQVRSAQKADGSYDFSSNYAYVKQYLEEADLSMANMETTFSTSSTYTGYPGFNSPHILANNVRDAGVDVALFANNHMLDSKLAGAKNTVKVLNEAGFLAVVGARIEKEDPRSRIVEVEGVKIGIVAFTYETPLYEGSRTLNGSTNTGMNSGAPDYINTFRYVKGSDNKWHINSQDLDAIKAEIDWCKANGAEITICYFHWGTEYKQTPDNGDSELAVFAAENGADIIFGGHPHVLQPIKMLEVDTENGKKTVPVFYSLGNFISNQRYESLNGYSKTPGEKSRLTEQGMIANVELVYDRETGSIRFNNVSCIPTWVDRYPSSEPYTYTIVPLVGNFESNPMLVKSGHVSRAKSALSSITNLVGEEFIYKPE